MSIFTGVDASKLFSQYLETISAESDRGAVLVAAALLDEGLELALKKKLVPPTKSADALFNGGHAPLRSFSAKIELAFTRTLAPPIPDHVPANAKGTDPKKEGERKGMPPLLFLTRGESVVHRWVWSQTRSTYRSSQILSIKYPSLSETL